MKAQRDYRTIGLTTRALANYLRNNQLDVENWARLPLTAEAKAVIQLDLTYHAENGLGHQEHSQCEVFIPTEFGCISGFKYALQSATSNEMVYGVGIRIFADCDYRNPNEWIWAGVLREVFQELINNRLDDEIGLKHDVFVDGDTGAAIVCLFLESSKPEIRTNQLADFLANYFESGNFDLDIQKSFYSGWKKYLSQDARAT